MSFLSDMTESMFFRGTSLPLIGSAQHYGLTAEYGEASISDKESVLLSSSSA